MKRLITLAIIIFLVIGGCSTPQLNEQKSNNIKEEQIQNAVNELINAINNGDIEIIQKYVGVATPVAEKLVDKLKNNIKLKNVRDISIQGTTATATVTLEIVPLKVNKDLTLSFDITDAILWNNPLGLLSVITQ